jgi:4-alpha-glucanotransferase
MKPPLLTTRAAGVVLHPTSLPGPFGSGDLGPEAYQFADDLVAAGQRWWQTLPTNPPDRPPANSPYSSPSAFAGSPFLISLEMLVRDGLLKRSDVKPPNFPVEAVDFPRVRLFRLQCLSQAFERYGGNSRQWDEQIDAFAAANAEWLDDYCLFAALKDAMRQTPWVKWPRELGLRKPAALAKARHELERPIRFQIFVQWLFDRQWTRLRGYCNSRGIGLIGDVPIFVSHDSADVWARRELFVLDRTGRPTIVTGYPADAFSPRGQKWNHPHYRWAAHKAEGFNWWVERFRHVLRDYDGVRIDHFLGFSRAWAIAADAPNAIKGRWLKSPGMELFAALRRRLGNAAIIAEDLGRQTAAAIEMRDKFKFPGMRVAQFGFGNDEYHRPYNYPRNSVAYTGTHDTDTTAGWLKKVRAARDGQIHRLACYVGLGARPTWDIIRVVQTSAANTAIVPVQDLLELGSEQRMNVPGVERGNWGWRMTERLPADVIRRLRQLADVAGRA